MWQMCSYDIWKAITLRPVTYEIAYKKFVLRRASD